MGISILLLPIILMSSFGAHAIEQLPQCFQNKGLGPSPSAEMEKSLSFSRRFKLNSITHFAGAYLGDRTFLINSHSAEAIIAKTQSENYEDFKKGEIVRISDFNVRDGDDPLLDRRQKSLSIDAPGRGAWGKWISAIKMVRLPALHPRVVTGQFGKTEVLEPDFALMYVEGIDERLKELVPATLPEQEASPGESLLLISQYEFDFPTLILGLVTADFKARSPDLRESLIVGGCNDQRNSAPDSFSKIFSTSPIHRLRVTWGDSGTPVVALGRNNQPVLYGIIMGDSIDNLTADTLSDFDPIFKLGIDPELAYLSAKGVYEIPSYSVLLVDVQSHVAWINEAKVRLQK